jgi:hypothetical protein
MAANATFTRLNRADLGDLVTAAQDDDPRALATFLADAGTSVAEYDGDGEIFSVLLPILSDDYDIDLETSENETLADIAEATDTLVFILTQDDRERYLDQLAPDNFDAEELAELYEDFTEDEADGAGEAMLAAIGALHQALGETDAEHVIVVTAG